VNLLSLVQKFCKRTGIPSPATVYGSTDKQVLQCMHLLEEEVNDLASRHEWQALTKEATHTTLAAEDQGAISTIAPGFRYIRNDTIWDRTEELPVIGPMSAAEWQALKGSADNGPRFQYRIRGDHLLANPVPTAGHTWAFEFQTKYAILDVDGSTLKEFFTADTDTFLLPDSLLLMGLRWRWMREKGMSYSELFQSYEVQVKDAMSRDGGRKRLYADGEGREVKPGIFVPNGNWLQS
jgi:hypothetical protein